jgi:hypothetical protein
MVGALMAAGALGCATGGGENELRARAAYDLSCPAESLAMTQLQEKNFMATTNHGATYGVSGCGRRATYVNNVGAWVLNNREGNEGSPDPRTSPAPAPAPAPTVQPASSSDTRL